jgi:hypothetical protein
MNKLAWCILSILLFFLATTYAGNLKRMIDHVDNKPMGERRMKMTKMMDKNCPQVSESCEELVHYLMNECEK